MSAYIDDIVVHVTLGLGLVAVVSAFALVTSMAPVLLVLAPVLALPVSGLMRVAVAAARDEAASIRLAVAELRRAPGRKLVLATIQLLVVVISLSNLVIARDIGGFAGVLSGLVSAYALLVVGVLALTTWPIVCDPRREGPIREQLRLALAAGLLRPFGLLVLLLIAVLAAVVCVQLLVPSLFLPALVLLTAARYVVPLVDRLRPVV